MPLLGTQSTRIVGFHVHAVENQRQLAHVINTNTQFSVGEILPRAAVVAITFGRETGSGHGVIHIPGMRPVTHRAGGFHSIAPGTVTAVIAAGLDGRRLLPGLGRHVDHAARGVAIKGREGAAQHFYAVHAGEIDIGGLSLSIRHGCRNTVDIHTDTAHAEG